MVDLHKPRELVEKIFLETRPIVWVALSIGGCGNLTHATVGRHDEDYMETRSTGLTFAHRVIEAMGLSRPLDRVSTPQILVETAAAVIDDPQHVELMCTTWRCVPEGVEICSVGTTSVLVFEGETVREAIIPHSINELLRSQGLPMTHSVQGQLPTHALGGRKGCRVEDVRVAHVPLLETTTIAVIGDRRLADDILKHAVARNELSSFIESWSPPGKRIRTSVLISL